MIKRLRYRKWKNIIEKSGLFDIKYYLFTYPDVRQQDINPIIHYIKYGAKEGRNPSEEFDTNFYLTNYSDVKESKMNPLIHYILYGKQEGRKTMIKKLINEIKTNGVKSAVEKSINKIQKRVNNQTYVLAEDSKIFEFQFHQNNSKNKSYIEYETKKPINTDIKLIAYYLPQFHPIPQNDKSWGKGFTEWTNVTKVLPQFEGHYQPRLAGELGYYDLRLKEIQKRQIELAKNYGLHGFCYHYYWFDGQKVMDTPLQQVLDNPDLDFPFCINWANENWTKRWDGLDQDVILAQNHTIEDDLAFIEAIKPILTDKRYIKIDNKPLLMVYRPKLFPNIKDTVKRWRNYARENGIGELYLVISHAFEHIDPKEIDFDAAAEFAPNSFQVDNVTNKFNFFNKDYQGNLYDYESAINYSISYKEPNYTKFRSLCPSWDNEARKPGKGTSFVNATPDNYSKWLEYILYYTNTNQKQSEKLVFINAWNEWAEGAYLEPDRQYGYAYLDKTYQQLEKFSKERLDLIQESKKNKKLHDTAVVLHLYYIELYEEMKEKLKYLENKFDLYININNNSGIEFFKKVLSDFPNAKIYSCENRGRDILPFIEMMKDILPLDYKYICKIHSKKSLHRVDGDRWRNHLIDSLLSSKEKIVKIKNQLDSGIGIIVAKGNIFSYQEWIGSNDEMVKQFAKKADIKIPNDFTFPAGSMFWFNPNIFEKLVRYVDLSKFDFEKGQIDGTKAHAVERVFGILCLDSNKVIKEI